MAFTNRDMNTVESEVDLRNFLDSSSLFAMIRIDKPKILELDYWCELTSLIAINIDPSFILSNEQLSPFLSKLTDNLQAIILNGIDSSCLDSKLFSRFRKLEQLCLTSGRGYNNTYLNVIIERSSVEKLSSELNLKTFKFSDSSSLWVSEFYDGKSWNEYSYK